MPKQSCERKSPPVLSIIRQFLLNHCFCLTVFLAGGKEDEHLSSTCSAVRQVELYGYTAVHLASCAYGVKLQTHLREHQLQTSHWAAESVLQTLPWGSHSLLEINLLSCTGRLWGCQCAAEGRSENCSVLYRVCGGQVKVLKKDGKMEELVLTSCPQISRELLLGEQ